MSDGVSGATPRNRPVTAPPSELPVLTGILLVVANGFIDAVVYLRHGHVFAVAMTGNLVLAGVGLVRPGVLDFVPPLVGVLAFFTGLISVAVWEGWARRRLPQLFTLAVESAVLVAAALVPSSFPQVAVAGAIAFVSGMQVAVFGLLGPVALTTTVMTANSKRAIDSLLTAIRTRSPRDMRRASTSLAAVLGFAVGVVVGAAVCWLIGNLASLVPAAMLLVVGVGYLREARTPRPVDGGRTPTAPA